MLVFAILVFGISGRFLQQNGVPPQKGEKWDQSNQALDKIFDHISGNLTQQQQEELELIEDYIFNEGIKYYAQASQQEKQKIFLALFGMIEELEKESGYENTRLEKDIEYFSQLNMGDQDIVMTKISQSLDKTLKDSSKEFNSEIVLQTIKREIENFQSNPDRSTVATWNIKEYKKIEEQNKQDLKEIEYQIEEFLDQGLQVEKIKEKITEFIDSFFTNSTLFDQNNNNIDEIISHVKEQDENDKQSQKVKSHRQKIRELIREQLELGKTEDEIYKEVDEYLKKNEVNDLNDEEINLIKLLIKNEMIRKQRLQNTPNNNDVKTEVADQNNIYYIIIGISTLFLLMSLLVFLIRRHKMKQNQTKQIGLRLPEQDLGF